MIRMFTIIIALFSFIAVSAQEKPEGLFINSKAPEIKGIDQNGVTVSLKEMRKKGNVVVVFYRGNWCPYCNKHLKKLSDSLQFITEKGAQVIAVTPEMEEGITKTVDKTSAKFSIVHDEKLKIMKAYDVEYALDEKAVGRYKNGGIDLATTNEKDQANILPVPAVFIVNKEGYITYRYFDADYKKRVTIKEILDNLK